MKANLVEAPFSLPLALFPFSLPLVFSPTLSPPSASTSRSQFSTQFVPQHGRRQFLAGLSLAESAFSDAVLIVSSNSTCDEFTRSCHGCSVDSQLAIWSSVYLLLSLSLLSVSLPALCRSPCLSVSPATSVPHLSPYLYTLLSSSTLSRPLSLDVVESD